MDVWGGLIFSNALKRITEDAGPTSINPLFDSDYAPELQDKEKYFRYTTQELKGYMSGLAVTVSFSHDPRTLFSALTFYFSSPGKDNTTIRNITFQMGLNRRLKKNIKPDILKFVYEIKSKKSTAF